MSEALIESPNGSQVPSALEAAAMNHVAQEERLFALAQRKARVYSESKLVPEAYQGKIGNVIIAQNMADRMGADVLMVMQNLYIVHGRPGWSAQFLIATFNSCGRFSSLRYRFTGTPGKDDWGCVAYATEKETGETLSGSEVTLGLAKAEGWHGKNGSKWRTMPEQMLRYRAATFFIRSVAPEIGMGLLTKEELEDTEPPPKRAVVERLGEITAHLEGPTSDGPHQENIDQTTGEEDFSAALLVEQFADKFTECKTKRDVDDRLTLALENCPAEHVAALNAAADAAKERVKK